MNKGNFVDDMNVHWFHQMYLKKGMTAVVEDGHVSTIFNENIHNKKAYEALTDYGKEVYRNTIAVDIE